MVTFIVEVTIESDISVEFKNKADFMRYSGNRMKLYLKKQLLQTCENTWRADAGVGRTKITIKRPTNEHYWY